jgi:Tol biopolymer transport system component
MLEDTDQQKPQKSHASLLSGLLLVVVLGGVLWFFLGTVTSKSSAPSLSVPTTGTGANSGASTPARTLSGDILISAAKPGEQNASLYLFDTAHKTLQLANVQGFNPSESADGRYIVASYVLSTSPLKPNGIYIYDLRSGTTALFAQSVGTQLPRTPQLSPDDGSVVFNEPSSASSSLGTFHTPSFWKIYLAHGIYPHWSPDGSNVLYLGDDGLHLYTIALSQDTLAYPVTGGTASTFLMFALSKDGSKIAWADPGKNQLLMGDITSWQPFKIVFSNVISAYAYWPVFSPDGTKLAFGQLDLAQGATSTQITNQRFTVVDLQTGQSEQLLDLTPYVHLSFFATDWVSNL